jgi:F-type H+-transporting ATPase subunit b
VGLVTLSSVAAQAASAGGEFHYNWWDFLLRIINIAIFIAVLYYLLHKKIRSFFGGRRETIEHQLTDLSDRKSQAHTRLEEVEEKISDLEQERARILADYKAQGETIRDSIIKNAEASAEQIKAQAKTTAAQEAKQAVENLRAEMAEMVVDSAQHILEEKLTTEEHEALIDKYLNKVVLN